jgi:hypothetical protein
MEQLAAVEVFDILHNSSLPSRHWRGLCLNRQIGTDCLTHQRAAHYQPRGSFQLSALFKQKRARGGTFLLSTTDFLMYRYPDF